MNKLIFTPTILFCLILSSCYPTQTSSLFELPKYLEGTYQLSLTNVERPESVKNQFVDYLISTIADSNVTRYSYSDSLLTILWLNDKIQFQFLLSNKTNNSIKIIWDDAAYVDVFERSHRVIHAGIKYAEMDASMPSTIIVKGTSVEDVIMPSDNIRYSSYSGFYETDLFPTIAQTQEDLNEITRTYLGKKVKILLPLRIEETTNEYLFVFTIDNFIQK